MDFEDNNEEKKDDKDSSECEEEDDDENQAFKSIAKTPQGSNRVVHASPMNLFDEEGFTQNYTEREDEHPISGARSMTQIR